MKPEESERLFVETLFSQSVASLKVPPAQYLEIEKLTGDASTRRYYRLQSKDVSYVVCLDTQVKDLNDYPFWQVHAALQSEGVRVPIIFDIDVQKGYILEEDLGDETLLRRLALVENKDEELKFYKDAIDALMKIHHVDPSKTPHACFVTQSFDYEKYAYEIDFTFKYFLKMLIQHELTKEEEYILKKSFDKICKVLGESPKVVTHRDYHSRNIMFSHGEQIVIDFQDARLGVPQYDLVSLLEDCYYQLDETNKKQLVDYYYQSFIRGSRFDAGYEQFLYHYDLMTIQRVFKAIGSFAYIYSWRKDIRYLKYIGYAYEKIKHVMFKYPEFDQLRMTLTRIYYDS